MAEQNGGTLGALTLTDKSGTVKAVVIGVGEHLVAVPFDKVKFVTEPVAHTGAATAPNTGTARPASTTTTGAAITVPLRSQ